MIRIDVPATSANLGSGFDSLGIALTMQNRVWMEESDTLEIRCTDGVKVPTDESNLIFWAAQHLYEICGKKLPGLKIIQENNIPMARGLGSSSACIVAGILGANRFMGNPLSHSDLINLAAQIEGHPDNTSPALSGGLVASAMEGKRVYSVSVPVSEKIRFAVMIPPFELKTEEARAALPKTYSREDAVYNESPKCRTPPSTPGSAWSAQCQESQIQSPSWRWWPAHQCESSAILSPLKNPRW